MRFERTERRRTPNSDGESPEMREAEVKETVKVKLPEQQPDEINPQEERKRSAEMSELPKLEAEMVSEQSNRKPHAENRKDPKIPDGEIMAAINAELSEQHPEDYSRKTDCRC